MLKRVDASPQLRGMDADKLPEPADPSMFPSVPERRIWVTHFALLGPLNARRIAGEVGQAGLVDVPHVTRSPTVAGSALAVGIMQCAAWAGLQRVFRWPVGDSAC